MAYKKPQIVAKSAAKQSFVAGCPTKIQHTNYCNAFNGECQLGPLR